MAMEETSSPWADTPFTLIHTPSHGEDWTKQHEAVFIAREMTFAHNGILRSLNSIYQQCIYVKEPIDIKDLLLYTRMWHDWIKEHHDVEEKMFFPDVERITGVKGLMKQNIEQHEAFFPGLEELGKYARETTVKQYNGLELREIIERFGHILTIHLSDEIQTLLNLKSFDGPTLKKAYLEFDLELRKGDSVLRPYIDIRASIPSMLT
jgi:hemerythrin-like domain-containing protein